MRIDFHTHLLPDIDDGSQSVAQSLEMLDTLRLQNVDIVIATPHFYSSKANLADFLERREKAYDLLNTARPDLTPKILLGAEVSFFRGMGEAAQLKELAIAGTNALLLEMPFSQWGRSEIAGIRQLLDRGLTPILAHVERYIPLQKDLTAFNEIINLPVYLQVNTQALLRWRTRRMVFRLIKHGFSVVLGTDCHNMTGRRPDMDAGREILARKFGPNCLAQIDSQAKQLLNIEKKA